MYHLVVVNQFDGYERGDVIDGPEMVAAILAGDHRGDVVKTAAPHPHIAGLAISRAEEEFAAVTRGSEEP